MDKIYVIGHKNPDTDSICSVIGYSDLLNRFEPVYIPARCGEINLETKFALSRFEIDEPVYIESLDPKISDMKLSPPISVHEDVPTIDVAVLMEKHDIKNVPVIDEEGKLRGLISERGLAKAYVRKIKIEQLEMAPISIGTLARIIEGKVIFDSGRILKGKVYTAIDALHVALSKLGHEDVAIVGDNEPDQIAFIHFGIAALIIANGAPVGERVINEAKANNTSIVQTNLDAFGVGKMINLSLPAQMVMAKDIPVLKTNDSIEYAKKIVYESKFRTACIVDDKGILMGVVTRTNLLEEIKKSVILLDHNEYTQAVDGIEKAEIVEIIDHHRIGNINTVKPVKFLNDPIGSTSTIITYKFIDAGVTPSPQIAGILLSGILSDTLVMKLSTTTQKDISAVDYLSGIAGIDPYSYGNELINAGMSLEGLSIEEILTKDMKRYNLFGKNIVISQIMVASFDFSSSRSNEIISKMSKLRDSMNVDCFFCLFTNVFENSSDLFISSDEECLLKFRSNPVRMEGVMSRKKDFLPHLAKIIK
ncbi:MAG: putative manganese-dependent inorganic diphosphatase [Athalassotoga sp.]|uniref:putative manganese-dependent inorganic diphosphatase n=1 Tax=Athalassotoga sp. TaxID=2022597 RepID=UPI000CC68366|nr:putative manganese-dependent inorganic diphosphatase [Mesoaciditoga lauensis]